MENEREVGLCGSDVNHCLLRHLTLELKPPTTSPLPAYSAERLASLQLQGHLRLTYSLRMLLHLTSTLNPAFSEE